MSAAPSYAGSAAEQRDIMVAECNRIAKTCIAFLEIQSSSNPLTAAEIMRLIELRPQYSILKAYAMAESRRENDE